MASRPVSRCSRQLRGARAFKQLIVALLHGRVGRLGHRPGRRAVVDAPARRGRTLSAARSRAHRAGRRTRRQRRAGCECPYAECRSRRRARAARCPPCGRRAAERTGTAQAWRRRRRRGRRSARRSAAAAVRGALSGPRAGLQRRAGGPGPAHAEQRTARLQVQACRWESGAAARARRFANEQCLSPTARALALVQRKRALALRDCARRRRRRQGRMLVADAGAFAARRGAARRARACARGIVSGRELRYERALGLLRQRQHGELLHGGRRRQTAAAAGARARSATPRLRRVEPTSLAQRRQGGSGGGGGGGGLCRARRTRQLWLSRSCRRRPRRR